MNTTTFIPETTLPPTSDQVSLWRWLVGFLLVGVAWGFTTPFMRRAALTSPSAPSTATRHNNASSSSSSSSNPVTRTVAKCIHGVINTLKNPAYAIPFLINVTGSVWFFLLIGRAELSLTVPIVNSCAFLFTVLGEWYVDGKTIDRNTWAGIALVLMGIGLCVQSKI